MKESHQYFLMTGITEHKFIIILTFCNVKIGQLNGSLPESHVSAQVPLSKLIPEKMKMFESDKFLS